ncbi:MAG: 2-C-methyl-D-erythritol 4-phosphate cytidylyltransferase [Chitinophagaceae bacterium]|nr:MAG: 2-C-methyl-D-erythritol 4-phosphate cytidylyltransferase [Chitinophagaceae bacterium]
MEKYAVIVAGGSGSRMNNNIPKQFLLLKNKPVLYYTLQTFLQSYSDMKIILVLPEEHVASGQEIIDAYFDYDRIRITVGGRTRFHSVQNGLKLVESESIVLVHDAVRCLVDLDLIYRCYETALEFGAAVPAIASKDSVRLITEEGNEAVERRNVRLIQTPQAFLSTILIPAYNIDYKDKYTDEATVVEAFGMKVKLVEGQENNIKITLPPDLIYAEYILNSNS